MRETLFGWFLVAPLQEHIFGLNVSVDDAGLVSVMEAVANPHDDFGGLDLLDFFLVAGVVERFAVDVFHADEEEVVNGSKIINGDEVGVVELGHCFGFGLKLFFEFVADRDFFREDFDDNFTIEGRLEGAIDGTHAALRDKGEFLVGGKMFGNFFRRRRGEAGRRLFFSAHTCLNRKVY